MKLLRSFRVFGFTALILLLGSTAIYCQPPPGFGFMITLNDQERRISELLDAFEKSVAIVAREYYRSLTDEDVKKLEEYLQDYFPKNLDQHTMLMSKKELSRFLESSIGGIGILVGLCPEAFKEAQESLKKIEAEFLTEAGAEKIKNDPNAFLRATQFLETVSPEYKKISEALIKGNLNYRGVYIKEVVEGSPAEKCGLPKGWYITKAGETNAAGRTLGEMTDAIRGEAGTPITIAVRSPDGSRIKTFTIIREVIEISPVTSRMIPGTEFGYIKISRFDDNCLEFLNKLEILKKAGAKALVIDVENNPGGNLMETLQIADAFIEPGKPLLYTKGRKDETPSLYRQSKTAKSFSGPIVVLINGGSASASEVLAGILQNYGLATIVGIKSYGKGSVQVISLLPDNSGLKITIKKYHLPVTKACPDGIGITPDVKIEDDPTTEENEPLQKAIEILKGKI
ncbi:MAG: S41 family peptidase [Candidatus Falkowbacteria bacterium]